MRYAIVVGATGLTGKALVEKLTAGRHPVPVRAFLRRISAELPESVQQVVLERMDDAAVLAPHIPAGSWVFCCVGTTMAKAGSQEAFAAVDLDIPVALAKAAAHAGADGISVVSAAGAKASAFFFYNRIKGEMELSVQAAGLPAVHLFRPGVLIGKRAERRIGERIGIVLSRLLRPLFVGPLEKYAPARVDDLAEVMLQKARQGLRGLRVFQGKALQHG